MKTATERLGHCIGFGSNMDADSAAFLEGFAEHGSRSDTDEAPISSGPAIQEWPAQLNQAAYHGLAGEFVRIVEPHTEADPVALLLQFLIMAGNAIGRGPHFMAESDRHGLNEFLVLVGETAKGRKGTSQGRTRRVFETADSEWAKDRVQHGLSSGEGIIQWRADNGDIDGRLLIIETEFAGVLKVMTREGNVLSNILRQAWDSDRLRIMTKKAPAKVDGAHISLIGHVTADELRRYLSQTEAGNGFGNRILWACVRRARVLPDGGNLPAGALDSISRQLADVLEFARRDIELQRDEDARAAWHKVYEPLSEGKPGLLGSMIARGEAHVMRFSSLSLLR